MSIETSKNRSPTSTAVAMASASVGAMAATSYPSADSFSSALGPTLSPPTIKIFLLVTPIKILPGNHHVYADVAVDELGDAKVGRHRRRLVRLGLGQALFLLEQLYHLANRRFCCDHQRRIGPHRDPVRRRLRARPLELHVLVHHQLQAPMQIRLDRGLIDLSVTLSRVSIADFQQGTFDEDGDVERSTRDELLVVEIAGVARRRIAAHSPEGGSGRHAHRAKERTEGNHDAWHHFSSHARAVEMNQGA